MTKVKKVVLSSMLLALLIVLSRFLSIRTTILVISLGFIPTMLSAIWLGPKWTILIAGLGDLIGAIFFPFGAYFWGYTLSAIVAAAIYGGILYKKTDDCYTDKQFLIRLIIASTLVIVLVNTTMNTLWTSITAHKVFLIILPVRIIKQIIMLPIQVITIYLLEKALRKPFNKYIRSQND